MNVGRSLLSIAMVLGPIAGASAHALPALPSAPVLSEDPSCRDRYKDYPGRDERIAAARACLERLEQTQRWVLPRFFSALVAFHTKVKTLVPQVRAGPYTVSQKESFVGRAQVEFKRAAEQQNRGNQLERRVQEDLKFLRYQYQSLLNGG